MKFYNRSFINYTNENTSKIQKHTIPGISSNSITRSFCKLIPEHGFHEITGLSQERGRIGCANDTLSSRQTDSLTAVLHFLFSFSIVNIAAVFQSIIVDKIYRNTTVCPLKTKLIFCRKS